MVYQVRANTDGDGKITHGNSFLRLGLLQIISYLANSILQIPAYWQARERMKIQKVISLTLSTQRGKPPGDNKALYQCVITRQTPVLV